MTHSLSKRGSLSRWIVGLGIAAVTFAAVACKDEVAPSLAPSFAIGDNGAPVKTCFDAHATPVTFGAPLPLTTSPTDPTPSNAGVTALLAINMAASEINQSCGIRVGLRKGEKAESQAGKPRGSPLAVLVRDNANDSATAAQVTSAMIAAGVDAFVGGGASGTGLPSLRLTVPANIPLGSNQNGSDYASGCTRAELADPGVIKSDTPVYGAGTCYNNHGLFFRTTAQGFEWGSQAAAYARQTYPTRTRAAIIYRDDSFGQPNRDGWVQQFVALGGTAVAQAGHVSSAATTQAVFQTQLMNITSGALNPSLIVGSLNNVRLGLLMQAYVALRDTPALWTAAGKTKPTDFNTIQFVWTSTLAGFSYTVAGASAVAVLVNQNDLFQPAWDPAAPAFQRWLALYQSFAPTAPPPSNNFLMGAYDAEIVMALAITAAGTTDGAAVAAKIREVTNPPGTVICPGQWQKAFRLLAKGKKINYEGASGPLDLDERGNPTGLTFGIFRVQTGGATQAQVGGFNFPVHPACTDSDDDDA